MSSFVLGRREGSREQRAVPFDHTSTKYARLVFCVLSAIAIASACSGSRTSALPPAGAPYVIFSGSPMHRTRVICRHRHRCKTIRPFDFYMPPRTVYGSKHGTYCYMTGAPNGPGTYPTYKCWLMPSDALTFNNLWQVATPGSLGPTWYCGPTYWTMAESYAGPMPSPMVTAGESPSPTGLGNWQCNRLDVVNATISRGADNIYGWVADYTVRGGYILCDRIGCSGPVTEIAATMSVNPGPAPTVRPTPVPTATNGGTPWPTAPPPVGLIIYDNRLNEDVSAPGGAAPSPSSVIGLENNLTAKRTDGGSPTNVNWATFGNASIISQDPITAPSVSDVLPIFPTPGNPAKFYWYVGTMPNSQSRVVVTAYVNGVLMTALALYSIEAPQLGQMSATFNTPTVTYRGIPNQPFLQLGTAAPSPAAGIISTYTATAPPDFGGYYAENQQVISQPTYSPSSIPTPYPTTGPGNTRWLDGCWIYNVNGSGNNLGADLFLAGSQVTYGPTFDAPNYPLDQPGMQSLTVDDFFTDYFMYRPKRASTGAIWVNFGVLSWHWGGTAAFSGLTWRLSNGFANVTSSGKNQDLVAWPKIYQPGSDCPGPPAIQKRPRRSSTKSVWSR